MSWLFAALMLGGVNPIAVEKCELDRYWVSRSARTVIAAETIRYCGC